MRRKRVPRLCSLVAMEEVWMIFLFNYFKRKVAIGKEANSGLLAKKHATYLLEVLYLLTLYETTMVDRMEQGFDLL